MPRTISLTAAVYEQYTINTFRTGITILKVLNEYYFWLQRAETNNKNRQMV